MLILGIIVLVMVWALLNEKAEIFGISFVIACFYAFWTFVIV
jgi:hypothetical protein